MQYNDYDFTPIHTVAVEFTFTDATVT